MELARKRREINPGVGSSSARLSPVTAGQVSAGGEATAMQREREWEKRGEGK